MADPEPRARFHFATESVNKNLVVVVKTIQKEGEDTIYEFPKNFRTKDHHPKLFDTTVVKNVKKSLNARGKFRNVWISLTEELKGHYLDIEGNVCYDDYYLDEYHASTDLTPNLNRSQSISHDNLSSRVKNMMLDKFSGKNQNAKTFIDLFVEECERLEIKENQYAETLKIFVEGPALDWFQSFQKTHKITRPWEFWKNSFVDTFAVIGWQEIKYAYDFKHIEGPLLDYALKKRNLLLNADSELTENTQINFIVLGLPQNLRSHIKRKDLTSVDDLMSCIRQLEGFLQNRNKTKIKSVEEDTEKRTCAYCKMKGFTNRFHAENVCRLKIFDGKNMKNDKIKVINNTNIQESVSSSNVAKNE